MNCQSSRTVDFQTISVGLFGVKMNAQLNEIQVTKPTHPWLKKVRICPVLGDRNIVSGYGRWNYVGDERGESLREALSSILHIDAYCVRLLCCVLRDNLLSVLRTGNYASSDNDFCTFGH